MWVDWGELDARTQEYNNHITYKEYLHRWSFSGGQVGWCRKALPVEVGFDSAPNTPSPDPSFRYVWVFVEHRVVNGAVRVIEWEVLTAEDPWVFPAGIHVGPSAGWAPPPQQQQAWEQQRHYMEQLRQGQTRQETGMAEQIRQAFGAYTQMEAEERAMRNDMYAVADALRQRQPVAANQPGGREERNTWAWVHQLLGWER